MKIARHFKENLKEVLTFSVQEKRGIIVLIAGIAFVMGLKIFVPTLVQNIRPLPITELNDAVKKMYAIIDTNPRKPFVKKSYSNYYNKQDSSFFKNSKDFAQKKSWPPEPNMSPPQNNFYE